ncbi:DUF805 domain-containing protein [Sedimentitalea nanhaiensis]|uniref:Uncharacterized membrane protein YhaH, DUF805 family n=1 Tax=Sedimentitalea nanhaiensis TaxID=999627 RepID=A0A1I7CVZ2_9RHOB|nr:DUF805 domain-containing protein [Sedimentitalea nanhaiensis]SFU03605.1 Uncharacterized membrane protein YhaH, DUF805 family [Sedimentitalea nanhaiensis]
MDFKTSVRTCFNKYATFSGRAVRPEYWWFALFLLLCSLAVNIVDYSIFGDSTLQPLSLLFSLAVFLPSIAVGVRRLHDIDRTGWWMLIGLLPIIGFLVLLYFFVQRGTAGPNRYGPA